MCWSVCSESHPGRGEMSVAWTASSDDGETTLGCTPTTVPVRSPVGPACRRTVATGGDGMRQFWVGVSLGTCVVVTGADAQLCPAVTTLTLTCGNGSCDLGETEATCTSDCADPRERALGYFAEYASCARSDVFFPKNLHELQLA